MRRGTRVSSGQDQGSAAVARSTNADVQFSCHVFGLSCYGSRPSSRRMRPSLRYRWMRRLSRGDAPYVLVLYGFVALLHLLGWGLFLHFSETLGVREYSALGALAYGFGLRHAFDADHISAIDDTTRLLVQSRCRRRGLGVGFFFALGHSTLVLSLSVALVLAAGPVGAQLSWLPGGGGLAGTLQFPASFLPGSGPQCGRTGRPRSQPQRGPHR